MNVAISTWCGRVSPVLDTAGRLLVVTAEAGRELSRHETTLTRPDLAGRAAEIAAVGMDVLICGALSQVLESLLVPHGITVVSHVCGDVEQVLHIYLSGESPQERFSMPGCCRRRHRGGRRGDRGCHRRRQRQG